MTPEVVLPALRGGFGREYYFASEAPTTQRMLPDDARHGALRYLWARTRIANLDESTAHWLKVSATMDGSFTVTNGRTGETKAYGVRSGTSRPIALAAR